MRTITHALLQTSIHAQHIRQRPLPTGGMRTLSAMSQLLALDQAGQDLCGGSSRYPRMAEGGLKRYAQAGIG